MELAELSKADHEADISNILTWLECWVRTARDGLRSGPQPRLGQANTRRARGRTLPLDPDRKLRRKWRLR